MSLAQNFVDLLTRCLNISQESIDSCQKVIDMCSGRDFEDCGKEIGVLVVKVTECIKCCQQAINHGEQYLNSCNNRHCSELVQQFIDKAEKCIHKCEAVSMQCKERSAFCMSASFECLKACQELVQSIAALQGHKVA